MTTKSDTPHTDEPTTTDPTTLSHRLLTRVTEKARLAGVSVPEYLAGILEGRFPKIARDEVENDVEDEVGDEVPPT
jgi:hypothetical protein